ncbi:helix-turn-helix domain-containing protein [Streptomyces sp. MUM 203J]|uniref:helix-turn-helix domain-containing protein n=1 Tax=Streptomyces sp. MUM 203J TaxID=2791990 RepID=UPI001F044CEB|nr:helix-turn-helix domain-containing protein [Streptomyces sp. MUM 203J]MCH0538933.1 helix-turn-helix domain-containing protein [Streptomyces sp. MUM 203J]
MTTSWRDETALSLTRLVGRPGATGQILDWLVRHQAHAAAVLGADGEVLAAPRQQAQAETAALASALRPGDRRHPVHLVPLAVDGGAPYLAATLRDGRPAGGPLTEAARVLGLAQRLERAERDCLRLRSAEAHSREAVLHLLMVGEIPPAQRIAAALRPPLPQSLRVLVVECPAGRRDALAARVARLTGERTWLVPCPVRPRHLIALVPSTARIHGTAGGEARPGEPSGGVEGLVTAQDAEWSMGMSDEFPLRETATGYEQAFHALAVARGLPDRCAGFGHRAGTDRLVTGRGRAWAARVLAPCLAYVPARRADPGASELLGTLSSWLTFGSAANRHLKLHRNTLTSRVRLLSTLLGLDLARVPGQATAWLALRLHTAPGAAPSGEGAAPAETPGRPLSLPDVLAAPAAQDWARAQLAPLGHQGPPHGAETIRAWLRADTRIPPAADALGISPAALRKRLRRAEQALGRSLLQAPSAKHELWLAMAALSGDGGAGPPSPQVSHR